LFLAESVDSLVSRCLFDSFEQVNLSLNPWGKQESHVYFVLSTFGTSRSGHVGRTPFIEFCSVILDATCNSAMCSGLMQIPPLSGRAANTRRMPDTLGAASDDEQSVVVVTVGLLVTFEIWTVPQEPRDVRVLPLGRRWLMQDVLQQFCAQRSWKMQLATIRGSGITL
jgi:hypothetical protein